MDELLWAELHGIAERTVQETIAELSEEIRLVAEKVPCVFREWQSVGRSGALGQYFGYRRQRVSDGNGPIMLYLAAIHRSCTEGGFDFADEVRITYLHELGHHLGLDEAALQKRGLR